MKAKKAYVYRNLHKGGFSIMVNNKVIKVTEGLVLTDVELRVRKGGSARAKREMERNVHAFAVGTVLTDKAELAKLIDVKKFTPVSYKPFQDNSFKCGHTGEPVFKCDVAVFKNSKMFIWSKNETVIE